MDSVAALEVLSSGLVWFLKQENNERFIKLNQGLVDGNAKRLILKPPDNTHGMYQGTGLSIILKGGVDFSMLSVIPEGQTEMNRLKNC